MKAKNGSRYRSKACSVRVPINYWALDLQSFYVRKDSQNIF